MTTGYTRKELQSLCRRYRDDFDDAPACNATNQALSAWADKHALRRKYATEDPQRRVTSYMSATRAASSSARRSGSVQKRKQSFQSAPARKRASATKVPLRPAESAPAKMKTSSRSTSSEGLTRKDLRAICKYYKDQIPGAPSCKASNAVLRAWAMENALSLPSAASECRECEEETGTNVYEAPDETVRFAHVTYPDTGIAAAALPRRSADYYGIAEGNYRRVGEGSYGMVLRSTGKDGDYATKISKIPEALSQDSLVEVSTLIKLNHPNIVQLVDIVDLGNLRNSLGTKSPYGLVYKLADDDLNKYLYSKLSEETKKSLMYQLLCGLSYMHSLEIMHRDLKPQNILMFGDTLKIADLGSAKNYACHPRGDWTDLITTLPYRAPELLQKELLDDGEKVPAEVKPKVNRKTFTYDKEIDIWSVGVIFYEILTGRRVYNGDSEADQLLGYFRRLRNPVKTLPGFSKLDVPVQRMILSMLQFAPAKRPTAYQLLQDPYWDDIGDEGLEYISIGCDNAITMQSRSIDTRWKNIAEGINLNMVYSLLDWLFVGSKMFRLNERTFSVTSKLVCESLLQMPELSRNELQKLGCVCMDIASKMSEFSPLEASEYVYLSDGAFTKKDFLEMEQRILELLQFDVSTAVAPDYSPHRTYTKGIWSTFVTMMSFPSFRGGQLTLYPPADVAGAADEILGSAKLSASSIEIAETLLKEWEGKNINKKLKKTFRKGKIDYEAVIAASKSSLNR